ncbi:ATP-binding protein [Desulfitobacterium sp. THU1]|uniref:ATP-binding protein n=1 Tax=Desulfitobacterium sp. THU1 TaxID=3138072 RepID=UPI00311FE2DF
MSSLNLESEEPGRLFGATPGFRLHKLEVYNWGTFDGKVWTFSPQGETSLLTGDVGSGKSTLVDALTTLLVHPRKVAYNKAADSSAKERSVTSYVRGYFGQKRSSEGNGQPDSLRDTNHYSVILATFLDQGLSQHVTLAQFFWFPDPQKSPVRFYIVADKEMWITQDFARFNNDVRALKKRLKTGSRIQIYEDYTRYAEVFRRKFGIVQEQALDLFQQTISMKKVEALTDFVRTNMLEVPDTAKDVDKLIKHFHDLNGAHEAVLKAKQQIQLLAPLVDQGNHCLRLEDKQKLLNQARQALGPWFAERRLDLLSVEIAKQEQKLILAVAAREQAEVIQRDLAEKIKGIERAIYANGGDALERLAQDIETDRRTLERLKKNMETYTRYAQILRLPTPNSLVFFLANQRRLVEFKQSEEEVQRGLKEDLKTAVTEEGKARRAADQIDEELASLRSRTSSIPREFVEKRRQLCQVLQIGEEELPFVGELLEVRAGEESWEGAIERLLHSFSLSLLVPERHYQAVMQWVDRTQLGMRLVYYRVQDVGRPSTSSLQNSFSAAEKLNIRPGTPFGVWLSKELRQRFAHVCCETMEQFRREAQAITQSGQMKTGGKRHEKDDRHGINDRRRYVLGFSNQRKIAALEESEQTLRDEAQFYLEEMDEIYRKQQESQERVQAVAGMVNIDDFADIDTNTAEKDIEEKEKLKRKLEQENDILQGLQNQLTELMQKQETHVTVVVKAHKDERTMEDDRKALLRDKESTVKVVAEATLAMREEVYPYLEQHQSDAFRNSGLTLDNGRMLERDYLDWIERERNTLADEVSRLKNKMVKAMQDYNYKYPEETREIDSDLESLPEYDRMLVQLQGDGLPAFEQRFKQLLHENTINQIALFQAKLKQAQDTIQTRIEQINGSLNAIDYNEGRYIRLEYAETYDTDIKEFRVQLKACTEGALSGPEDEQYAETKFLQVKAIIERFRGRPGETERDERWTKKVIDVRNWFLFAASERWRETDEEYEHYTDSGGKSGGQKEKLAYTILAASLVYHFGLEGQESRPQSFRFVVIDEAFLKSSDESARFGLELFKKLELQLLIVTPLLKIPTIAKFIAHVGFVHHDDVKHQSMLRDISIQEYEQERKAREVAQYVH